MKTGESSDLALQIPYTQQKSYVDGVETAIVNYSKFGEMIIFRGVP